MLSGRHFLQIPGPTNVPERIVRAMSQPVIDHRSPAFSSLAAEVLQRLGEIFGMRSGSVFVFPTSGTGALEASLVNVLEPGDRVLVYNYGQFCSASAAAARGLGYDVDAVEAEWGAPLPVADLEARLRSDTGNRRYRALIAVHNETSTGVLSDIAAIRSAMDAAQHDALLIVDVVSSLAASPVCMDDWRIDVAFAGSQKGLMLPPGLGLVAASRRAVEISTRSGSPRNFFDWRAMIRDNVTGYFPYTPATTLLYGLREALTMLLDEQGLEATYLRHARLAQGVRAAVTHLGLALVAKSESSASPTLTAFLLPTGVDTGAFVSHARDHYGLSLGVGLGKLAGKAVRIGHLGALSELEVAATVSGVEMSLFALTGSERLGAGIEACLRSFVSGATASLRAETPQW